MLAGKNLPPGRTDMKHIIMICLLATAAYAGDMYVTASYRLLAYHAYENIPYDYEFTIGGSTVNYEWEVMRELEYGLQERGSLMDWNYDNFRFQFYEKTADDVHFSEAIWHSKVWKDYLVAGGSLYTDIILGQTKYMAYAKLDYKKLSVDFRHNGIDYYNLSVKFKAVIAKGYFKGLKSSINYRNINGIKSYKMAIKCKTARKKNSFSQLFTYEKSSNRPKKVQVKLIYDF